MATRFGLMLEMVGFSIGLHWYVKPTEVAIELLVLAIACDIYQDQEVS